MNHEGKSQAGLGILIITVVLTLVLLAALYFISGRQIISKYTEISSPVIRIVQMPRGVGIEASSLRVELSDPGSGLDEVVVRTRQRAAAKEILRQSLYGEKDAAISVEFPGEKSNLEEGIVYVEIKVFDRSFWNNSKEETFPLVVDYKKPKLEIFSTQHNARHGGSQLALYKAQDLNLSSSGVKIGSQTFYGYPASGLVQDITDPYIHAVFYALDLTREVDDKDLQLFAEDRVGNSVSKPFYNKIAQRVPRPVTEKLSDSFYRNFVPSLADQSFDKLSQWQSGKGRSLAYENTSDQERLIREKFDLVNHTLRDFSEEYMSYFTRSVRFETLWQGAFSMPGGAALRAYGDRDRYVYNGEIIGDAFQTGYELSVNYSAPVLAASDGIVLLCENVGIYGNTVVLDHGFGITSVYGHLNNISVRKGEHVRQGKQVGTAGNSGFSMQPNLYFGMRVQGVPVDSVEWADPGWFKAHITDKLSDLKRQLGIAEYRPLEYKGL